MTLASQDPNAPTPVPFTLLRDDEWRSAVTPEAPIAWAIGGLGLTAEGVVPAADWLLHNSQGKTTQQENGLHYLLNI